MYKRQDKVSASNGFPETLSGLNYSGVFGDVLYPGFRINENFSWLSWETVEEANVGFELGLFRNRLRMDFDYYHRMTRDAVISVPVPTSTDMVPGNWGKILNQGVELTLGWSDTVGKDFSYNIGFNMSTLSNKVKSLKYGVPYVLGGNTQFRTITRPGDSMYSFFGYKVTGVYQNDAQIQADPIAVSYTHLDVYKRQALIWMFPIRRSTHSGMVWPIRLSGMETFAFPPLKWGSTGRLRQRSG